MKTSALIAALVATAKAQTTLTLCSNYTSTVTFTAFQTFYSTCGCPLSSNRLIEPTYTFATTTGAVVLPDATIVPSSSSILMSSASSDSVTTTSSSILTSSSSSSTSPRSSFQSTTNSTGSSFSFVTSLVSSSTTTSTVTLSSVTTLSSTTSTLPISSTQLSSSSSLTSTTSISIPVVTDQAYINTILRHHNIHRLNHTAVPLSWSDSLASTAQTIASSCRYGHVVDTNGGGYGQNIGAGYLPFQMGLFVTEGLYNSEVNNYIYYGGEPDISTLNGWGHFSQIVWKDTQLVGCYTQDCSSTGLAKVGANVPPYFTVCNYSPPGNVIGEFAVNVGPGIGLPTAHQSYGCPTDANCV